jgi:hypothetical protein
VQVTLDFAGRRVVEEENEVGKTMYDHRDAVVQDVHYRPNTDANRGAVGNVAPGSIVNPSIVQPAPKVSCFCDVY